MEWGDLNNLWWLLLLAAFFAMAFWLNHWRKQTILNFADSHLIHKILPIKTKHQYWLHAMLLGTSILLVIIALINPLYGYKEQTIKREGIDLIFALDLSNSMNAEDVAPSRLWKAKKIIKESTKQMGGDRVGLVIFAGNAYSASPLTTDYQAIETLLETLSTDLLFEQGTNSAQAIEQSLELLATTQNRAKAIILISDGENHEPNINKAIEAAKEQKTQIITLGIGTNKGALIPIKENGQTIEYKKDYYGNQIISKLQPNNLKKIAEETNGKYIFATTTQKTMNDLFNNLATIEKTQYGQVKTQQKQSIYQWFLAFALLLLFIDSLTDKQRLFN